jgi:hypothetical protein
MSRRARLAASLLCALVPLVGSACGSASDGTATVDYDRELARLRSLGYLGGVVAGPPGERVVLHDPALAQPGLNLYNAGDAAEAFLMDMNGEVRHRWSLPYEAAFRERSVAVPPPTPGAPTQSFWRRVHLYPNGDLLAIFEGRGGLIKIDRESRLLWAVTNGAHHEVAVAGNGEIYVLTRTARLIPELDSDEPIFEDFITVLDPDGRELRRTSVLDALRHSEFADLLGRAPMRGDVMHTNTLKLLGDDAAPASPVFRPGNVLTSFRKLDAIAVLDLEVNRIVWALGGLTKGQHDPTLLADGHVLIFDNQRSEDSGSRVIEVNPATEAIHWQYPEHAPGIYSECCGTAQRLANGNTLITYSGPGVALEVTREGQVVWKFESPHRAGADQRLIAQLMEVRRVPRAYVRDWLDE